MTGAYLRVQCFSPRAVVQTESARCMPSATSFGPLRFVLDARINPQLLKRKPEPVIIEFEFQVRVECKIRYKPGLKPDNLPQQTQNRRASSNGWPLLTSGPEEYVRMTRGYRVLPNVSKPFSDDETIQ